MVGRFCSLSRVYVCVRVCVCVIFFLFGGGGLVLGTSIFSYAGLVGVVCSCPLMVRDSVRQTGDDNFPVHPPQGRHLP